MDSKKLYQRKTPPFWESIQSYFKTNIGILAAFLLFFTMLSIWSEHFLTSRNMINVMRQITTNANLAVGIMLCILIGGIDLSVGSVVLRGAHPNTVVIQAVDRQGRRLEVNASSLGGGRVRVNAIDGLEAAFTGDYPTLIIRNEDRPGQVAEVANLLCEHGVNIATMQLYRDRRGGLAVMVIESDQAIPAGVVERLRQGPGVVRTVYLNMGEE